MVPGDIPRTSIASLTSASVGQTTGMIAFTKAFVIVEVRPVIFTSVGIVNTSRAVGISRFRGGGLGDIEKEGQVIVPRHCGPGPGRRRTHRPRGPRYRSHSDYSWIVSISANAVLRGLLAFNVCRAGDTFGGQSWSSQLDSPSGRGGAGPAGRCRRRIPHDLRRTAGRNIVRARVFERMAMHLLGYKMGSCLTDITSSARHIFRRRSRVSRPPVHHRVNRRALP